MYSEVVVEGRLTGWREWVWLHGFCKDGHANIFPSHVTSSPWDAEVVSTSPLESRGAGTTQQKTQSWTPNLNDKGPHSFYLGLLRCSLLGGRWAAAWTGHAPVAVPGAVQPTASLSHQSEKPVREPPDDSVTHPGVDPKWAKKIWHHQALLCEQNQPPCLGVVYYTVIDNQKRGKVPSNTEHFLTQNKWGLKTIGTCLSSFHQFS